MLDLNMHQIHNARMTLNDFLSSTGMTETDFGHKILVTQSTVNRLRKGQVPNRDLMRLIFEKTNGQVTANDFFGLNDPAFEAPMADDVFKP
jgi:hypothetical protein